MPSKKKKYNARFPPARIKKIMQTDEEIGKVAAAVPVIIFTSAKEKGSYFSQPKQYTFEFLKAVVSSVPDVQGEDEQANPCSLDSGLSSAEIAQSSRHRRQKDRATSEDSAGPSHSTADESETWSAEEDGDEDSDGSSTESASNHGVVSSLPPATIPPVPCNIAFATSSSHHYVPHPVPCISSNNTTSSADDDYDS